MAVQIEVQNEVVEVAPQERQAVVEPDDTSMFLQGEDGASAYEIAVEQGFEGTIEEWLESLHGKDGQNGQNGYTPVKGKDYFDGKDGNNGKDGVPCTHSWNGTTLTVTSASGTSSVNLKGEKGDPGEKGSPGTNGKDGAAGKGIASIVQYYAFSSDKDTVPTNYGTEVPTLNSFMAKYMWGYDEITYSDGTKQTTSPRILAVYGDKGDPGSPGSDASVTVANITKALGYTPANKQTVDGLSGEKVDYADIEEELNETSENPVKNKTLFAKFKEIATQIANIVKDILHLKTYATPQMYEGTDTEKIQQAINENKYVLIPAGSYSVTSTITIPSDRKIQIEGTIDISCAVGFLIQGSNIEISGHGTVNISSGLTECSAFKFLVTQDIRFVALRDFTIWGSWNYDNSKNHYGVEFIGGSTVGTCCYVNVNLNMNCLTKAVYTHKASGQNADSWITQIDINSTFQNNLQAVGFDWMGDASRIRGVIQPKCTSAVTPNSMDVPLCVLPEHSLIDAMIWDMHAAMNKYAVKVNGNNCTVLSEVSRKYMDVNVAYEPTLMTRIPTNDIVTKDYFEENKPSLNVNFRIDDDGNLIMQENAPYFDLVPSGKDADGSILNDVGYVDNYRISASHIVTSQTGTVLTGFIPFANVSDADTIFTKGVAYTNDVHCGIFLYDESFNAMTGIQLIAGVEAGILYRPVDLLYYNGSMVTNVDEKGVATIKLNFREDILANNPPAYFRLFAKGKGSDLIITRNEEIVDYNPSEKNVGKVVADSNYSTEDWEFTLADGSTVTKKVVLA